MIWALLPRQRQSYQRNYYLEKIKVITYVGVLNEVIDGMTDKICEYYYANQDKTLEYSFYDTKRG